MDVRFMNNTGDSTIFLLRIILYVSLRLSLFLILSIDAILISVTFPTTQKDIPSHIHFLFITSIFVSGTGKLRQAFQFCVPLLGWNDYLANLENFVTHLLGDLEIFHEDLWRCYLNFDVKLNFLWLWLFTKLFAAQLSFGQDRGYSYENSLVKSRSYACKWENACFKRFATYCLTYSWREKKF